MSWEKLVALETEKEELEKRIFAEIAKTFPVRYQVTFQKGNHQITAEVLKHGYRGQLYIHNIKTGKEYWIDYHDLI